MKIKAVLILSLVLMLCVSANAETPFGSIKSVKSLPIHGVKLIESDKGVFFVSENGRFAWKGPILDMWNSKKISTADDAITVINHIDLKKIGIDLSQLSTLTMGKGKKEEAIFVSSDCPHCLELLKQAVKLKNQYLFRVVLLPMGKKSMEHTRKLLCAKDQEEAIRALVSGNYDGLETSDCQVPSLQKTLVVSRILGLSSVPYLIRHDGRVQSGQLKNLAAWLEGRDQVKTGKAKTKVNREAKKK